MISSGAKVPSWRQENSSQKTRSVHSLRNGRTEALADVESSHDQMDRVDRARLVESCGARDDCPSWNLGRAKQGDTIRVNGTSPRGRGHKDVKESEQGSAACKIKEHDAATTKSSENNPIGEEE